MSAQQDIVQPYNTLRDNLARRDRQVRPNRWQMAAAVTAQVRLKLRRTGESPDQRLKLLHSARAAITVNEPTYCVQRGVATPARANTACNNTLQPASRSCGLASSISLWLMPSLHGTKIIAVGVTRET